jgi:hypothetical protein
MADGILLGDVEFRDVVGIPGYKVGRNGAVLTCRVTSRGMTDTWKPLKCSPFGRKGYLMATMRLDGRTIRKLVHHLVLEAFVGPRPDGMVGCHDNDDNTDNSLGNLRWDTHKKNCEDRARNGRTARGTRQGLSRLTESDVIRIRELAEEGWSYRSIAAAVPVREGNIGHIAVGKTWRHVGGPIQVPCSRKRARIASGKFTSEARLPLAA